MTPTQIFMWMLVLAGIFHVWMFIYRPEQYEREVQRRNNSIKGVANVAAAVFKYFRK